MSEFTFEIVRKGDPLVFAHVLTLSDERTIWCQVEALALRIQNFDSVFIRVKNSEGEIVVRTGVATALASVENCSCADCPLKRELRHIISTGHHSTYDHDFHIDCLLSNEKRAA